MARDELMAEALHAVVAVDNLPLIPEEKHDKLYAVVSKIFGQVGAVRALDMPRTGGYAFVQYESPDDARRAVEQTDGYKLDKSHVFRVTTLAEVERLRTEVPALDAGEGDEAADEAAGFEPPADLLEELSEAAAERMRARPNLLSHLEEPRGRDQFLMRARDETSVHWHDYLMPPEEAYSRANWTESEVQWSPRGSYLATFHRQGIALWGGATFEKIVRFAHEHPRLICFSPGERYLVTFNAPDSPEPVIVWEVASGRKLRGFAGPLKLPQTMLDYLWEAVFAERREAEAANPMLTQMQAGETERLMEERERGLPPPPDKKRFPWPLLKFSHDDAMVARLGDDCVQVYGPLPATMALLDRRSVRMSQARDFEWSPSENLLAMWAPEQNHSPARVVLMRMPERQEVRQRALYSVADMTMHWHPQGRYLACHAERLTKSRKGRFSDFEIFRVNEKGVPVEVIEFREKDTVLAFAWEPHGDRFGIVHQDAPGRSSVTFYSMAGESVRQLFTLERKQTNALHWSPAGRGHALLAGLGSMGGVLEWWNVRDQELMGVDEHFACTDIEWDPTGRFVATSVSVNRSRIEHGYQMWTFYGKKAGAPVSAEELYQFAWRPRPPRWLLGAEEEKAVKKQFREYRRRFEAEDAKLRESRRSGRAAARRRMLEEWKQLLERGRERYAHEAEKRRALLAEAPGGGDGGGVGGGGGEGDANVEVIEEWIEEVLEVSERVLEKVLSADEERD